MKRIDANRIVLGLLLATVATTGGAGGGESGAPLPTVEEVLRRLVDGLGGRDAMLRIRSREAVGTIRLLNAQAEGAYELKAKAPDMRLTRMQLPGVGEVLEACDGQVSWESNPNAGFRSRTGKPAARARRFARFHRELELRRLYDTLTVTGRSQVDSRATYVLEAVPREGGLDRFYLDVQTGLVLRLESVVATGAGTMETVAHYEDYREVDGIKFPFRIRMTEPEPLSLVIELTAVRHNLDLDSRLFRPPSQRLR